MYRVRAVDQHCCEDEERKRPIYPRAQPVSQQTGQGCVLIMLLYLYRTLGIFMLFCLYIPQVDVGEGFDALGAVLWNALSYCQSEKDIHNASVIMMLSQVRAQ